MLLCLTERFRWPQSGEEAKDKNAIWSKSHIVAAIIPYGIALMFTNLAILIHGYTLLASENHGDNTDIGKRGWNYIVWGDSRSQLLGRVPRGILLALLYRPKKLIFGTGATCLSGGIPISRKQWEAQGKPAEVHWEANLIYEKLLQEFSHLKQFQRLQNAILDFGGEHLSRKFVEKISVTDIKCSNTKEEIANALELCDDESIDLLLTITSLSHAPRCVALANEEIANKEYCNLFYMATPCDTNFSQQEHTIIFEPPSGPVQRKQLSPCTILKEFFDLSEELKNEFLENSKQFFAKARGEKK